MKLMKEDIQDSFDEFSYDNTKSSRKIAFLRESFGLNIDQPLNIKKISPSKEDNNVNKRIQFIKNLINGNGIYETATTCNISKPTAVKFTKDFIQLCENNNKTLPIDIKRLAPSGLGKVSVLKGRHTPCIKLTDENVDTIRLLLSEGWSIYKINKFYQISVSTIFYIKVNASWNKNKIVFQVWETMFGSHDDCLSIIEKIIEHQPVKCPKCKKVTTVYHPSAKKYKCQCSYLFNVLKKTIFEDTKIKLNQWFYLIWYINQEGYKSIPNYKIGIQMGIQPRTINIMLSKISSAVKKGDPLYFKLLALITTQYPTDLPEKDLPPIVDRSSIYPDFSIC